VIEMGATPYHLATYDDERGPRAGLVVAGRLHDLADVSGRIDFQTTLGILQQWTSAQAHLQALAEAAHALPSMALESTRLLAPILYPPAVYCAGSNYADHVANMERRLGLPPGSDPRADGARPFHFLKASRCCVGPEAVVQAPSAMLDWEGELVVVIGAAARNVSVERAMDHVAGYMAGNDLSVRDLGFRRQTPPTSIFHHSFIDHKSFEHSAPVGPWITPASHVEDPDGLSIKTWVNDVLRQDGRAGDMTFSIAEQIAYLSSVATLHPGDILMTGTPAGAGAETGEFLKPGDRVAVSVGTLGTVVTSIA
jgi:2-keto-4-pentenoate hydratase/2-oxohepta-3-ene-1,7-dioic acid hydratase in catechol pathway